MKLNTIFRKLVPKENKFYTILKEMSVNIFECSELLIELTKASEKESRKEIYKQIKELEKKGDKILVKLFNELNSTFITPFDREDINALGERLDDVLDCMNCAAKRVIIYQPENLPPQSTELALMLKKGCELIQSAVDELDLMKTSPKIVKEIYKELHQIENQADNLYEHFIINIFENEKNGIELIKLKEIMQEIERATDRVDSVGKIIKTIVVKYA